MEPLKELADALYRERLERARRMSPEEKLAAGPKLFAEVCERMRAGIRQQFPDADEQTVQATLIRRVRRLRQVAEAGIYRPVEDADGR